jgi:hypothetical protein
MPTNSADPTTHPQKPITTAKKSSVSGVIQSIKKTSTNVKNRHIARRTSTGMKIALADQIDMLNPALWDTLSGETIFLSRDYLRVLEKNGPMNLQMRYAMVMQDQVPLAIMLFQRVQIEGKNLRAPTSKGIINKPLQRLQENLLICGNLLVWGARSIVFNTQADPATMWHAVTEAMYRLRRSDKLTGTADIMMIKDFGAQTTLPSDTLRLLGYRSISTEPDMVLTLRPEWKSFDDYLASMTSGYRSSAKKLFKDCANAGIIFRTITADEMLTRQNDIQNLYQQVHQVQSLRLATLNPSYLPAMAQSLGQRFVCRVAERNGQWLGFVTSVHDGETALGYYIGYERTANAQAPIYLTLLQSTVMDAIAFGAKRLSVGRTALEPKAKMGCKPEPLACAVRHRVSAVNLLVSALTRTASHDEPPERNPFKASAI